MNVCKLSVKFILEEWRPVIIYVLIFMVLVSLVNWDMNKRNEMVPVIMVNEDKDNILAEHFENYMEQYVELKKEHVYDDMQFNEDIFYDSAKVVIRVPRGFTEHAFGEKVVPVYRYCLNETQESVMVDELIYNYLVALKRCQEQNIKEEALLYALNKQLAKEVAVCSALRTNKRKETFNIYANYLSYALFSIILHYTILLLSYFKNEQIRQHNQVAPIHAESIYKYVILVSILIALALAFLLVLIGGFIAGIEFFDGPILFIILNVLCLSIYCVAFSSLIGMLVKSVKRLDILIQVIAFGLTFFSGVFVRQDKLPTYIAAWTKYIPVYLYVQINNEWSQIEAIKFHNVQEFIIHEGTILCASMVLILTALIIGEKKVEMDL